jgi:hypothetical protein
MPARQTALLVRQPCAAARFQIAVLIAGDDKHRLRLRPAGQQLFLDSRWFCRRFIRGLLGLRRWTLRLRRGVGFRILF